MFYNVKPLKFILPHCLAAAAVLDQYSFNDFNTVEIIIDILLVYCFQTSMIYEKEKKVYD